MNSIKLECKCKNLMVINIDTGFFQCKTCGKLFMRFYNKEEEDYWIICRDNNDIKYINI